jgi:hypothetical protein
MGPIPTVGLSLRCEQLASFWDSQKFGFPIAFFFMELQVLPQQAERRGSLA